MFRQFLRQELQRHVTAEADIFRLIHRACTAFSQAFPDPVTQGHQSARCGLQVSRGGGSGWDRRGGAFPCHRRHEPIAAFRHRFDEARFARRVAQGGTQLGHCAIDAVLEIDDGIVGPKARFDFFAVHQFAGPLQKQFKEFEGLIMQPDFHAILG